MQVAPLWGQPGLMRSGAAFSPGNDNKPRSPSSAAACPPAGRSGWHRAVLALVLLTEPPPAAAVLFSERQVSAGGLQLGAGEWRISAAWDSRSAVCLSPSKSTPTPPVSIFPSASSHPPPPPQITVSDLAVAFYLKRNDTNPVVRLCRPVQILKY